MTATQAYWTGVATPAVAGLLILLVVVYSDNLRRKRISPKDNHKGCGLPHEHRPWLPWRLMKVTVVPITNWRCDHGAQVPLSTWHSGGVEYSNTPEASEMRANR